MNTLEYTGIYQCYKIMFDSKETLIFGIIIGIFIAYGIYLIIVYSKKN